MKLWKQSRETLALVGLIGLMGFALILSSCQLTYLGRGLSESISILRQRKPLEQILANPSTTNTLRHKLELATKVRSFAESRLTLSTGTNYTSYVHLDRPYVSWIVQAAPAFSLDPYRWWFPIVGSVPYKGHFNEEDAKEDAARFDPSEYDTYVRGVAAFSSLGWVSDPLLSTMMDYDDFSLAELVIHESIHSTLYIKGQADFNEQLATYLGEKGARQFFFETEGEMSPTLRAEEDSKHDEHIFNSFLRREIKDLDSWYKSLQGEKPFQEKSAKLVALKDRFQTQVRPQLKTMRYRNFSHQNINNAYLSGHSSYYKDLEDFAKLDKILGGEFKTILAFCKNLEKSRSPVDELKRFVSSSTSARVSPLAPWHFAHWVPRESR